MWAWNVPLDKAVAEVAIRYPQVNAMVTNRAGDKHLFSSSLQLYWTNFIVDICRIKCVSEDFEMVGDTPFRVTQRLEVGKGAGAETSFKDGVVSLGFFLCPTVSRLELLKLHVFVTWMIWALTNTTGAWYWRLVPRFTKWLSQNNQDYPKFKRILSERRKACSVDDIIPYPRKLTEFGRKDSVVEKWRLKNAPDDDAERDGATELPIIPATEIPEGKCYEWKVVEVLGKKVAAKKHCTYPMHIKNGWRYVPADRHPWLECEGKKIVIGGMVLMERSQALTDKARAEDYKISQGQLDRALLQTDHSRKNLKKLRW